MAQRYDIKIDAGSSYLRRIKLTAPVFNSDGTVKLGVDGYPDRTGAPIVLTGYTVAAKLKPSYNSPETAAIAFTAAVYDAINGTIMIALTAAQTRALTEPCYVYDIEITSGDTVMRILQGEAVITPEVTQ